jgi:diguanylate cyclase (GGDEF)-like protein
VLLIDDDRTQFRLTQAHFAKFQGETYELEWAATYEDGLARLIEHEYAACLLDYRLGTRDGLQLIREAMAAGCRTPIVFLTAEISEEVDHAAMHAGASDFLIKQEITPRLLERSLRYARKLGATMEELRRLATRDSLTGLYNRREFERMLESESERSVRFRLPLGLAMIDVDQFKAINDTHGHPAGDAVLRELAGRLMTILRSVDRVARFGGEEFAALLVQTDAAGALTVAQRVCKTIAGEPVRIAEGRSLKVTVSIGVAAWSMNMDAAGMIAAADAALYAAKAAGRNCVVVAKAH